MLPWRVWILVLPSQTRLMFLAPQWRVQHLGQPSLTHQLLLVQRALAALKAHLDLSTQQRHLELELIYQ